jgi:Protein of unknown function (DUF3037)
MAERKQCEFQLIRYVPDPVKNEFVNIGVLLRAADGGQPVLRFTRDWGRVRCLDPDADTEMLEALEIEVGHRLRSQPADHPKPIQGLLEGMLSNQVQITDAKGYLPETLVTGLEDLMRQYVDSPKRERGQRRGGRVAVVAAMRKAFEEAGVWGLMRKQIPVADYTKRADSLRIDCGYRNGKVKMFQAVSLEVNADDAKLLAFTARRLARCVEMSEGAELDLKAIIEPLEWPPGENLPDEERIALYDYANLTMKKHGIDVRSTDALPGLAQTARKELRV